MAVAVFEFVKGTFVLLIGLGFLSLVHTDVQQAVEDIMHKMHVDPAWHFSKKLLEKAGTFDDTKLRQYAVLAFVLAGFRYVQAYGLWTEKHWAEWLTVLTAGFFVPWEAHHVFHKYSWPSLGLLLGNLAIVAYIAVILVQNRRERKRGPAG